jgi:hypothetical protein
VRAARIQPDGVPAAVNTLEELGDSARVPEGTPRVPALLRVAVYVAAALEGAARDELRAWTKRVADRLGIHPAALEERRADAMIWAAHRHGRGGRTVVRLTRRPGDPPERHRCTVWQVREDGTVRRSSTGDDLPRSQGEIARIVRDAVSPEEMGVPLVEVVVDREELHLPVDEWSEEQGDQRHAHSDDPLGIFAPAALGADFRVVLRCPELRRRSATGEADLRRRWSGCRTDGPLAVGERLADVRALKDHLSTTLGRSAGRVVLNAPAARRSHLVELCLFMGVPVVLWDRTAAGDGDASTSWLEESDPGGPLDSLPERIRKHSRGIAAFS